MILKAIIIDDQQHFAEFLATTITQANIAVDIIGMADNANAGFLLIKNLNPDLVFLDVEMPGKSGLELAKEFTERNFEIIFTTSHDKYAVQAFKTDAADYLLKPIDVIELSKAIDKISTRKKNQLLQSKVVANEHQKITVSTNDGVLFIELKNIIRCEADNTYTTLHIANSEKLVTSKPIKDFEERLSNSVFVRVHKSHLININFIKKFYKGDNAYVVMLDESIIPLSKKGREDLQNHNSIL